MARHAGIEGSRPYLAAQFAGAPAPGAGTVAVLLAEGVLTFAPMPAAFTVGGVSGAGLNPAVGTGPMLVHAIVGGGGFGELWYYWVGPITGALMAVPVFRMQLSAESDG